MFRGQNETSFNENFKLRMTDTDQSTGLNIKIDEKLIKMLFKADKQKDVAFEIMV